MKRFTFVPDKECAYVRISWNEMQKRTDFFTGFVVVVVLFYVHGKNLRSCRDGHLT